MTRTPTLDWWQLAKRLGIFAAVVVLLDLAIGLGLAALLPRVRAGQQVGVINNAIAAEADVVILGSSHAMHSYDDEALTQRLGIRVHNAGLDGRGVLFARGMLALISQRHAPKLVVLDVTFADRDRANAYAFAPYYGRSPIVDALLTEGDWRERVKLVSRSFRMNSVALAILGNLFVDADEWGFEPLTGKLPETARVGDTPVPPLANAKPFVEENLVALVEEARLRGARVVFTESPTFGSTRPADARAMYERVAARTAVPFIQIASDEVPGYGPALFRDRGHLNREGAEIFTALIEPQLRSQLRNIDHRKPLN
jgi:lysophospholipase L1-like esterase